MIVFTLLALFLVAVSVINLPFGYSLCAISRFFIPENVMISIGPIHIGFHAFILFSLIGITLIYGHGKYPKIALQWKYKKFIPTRISKIFERRSIRQNNAIRQVLSIYLLVILFLSAIPSETILSYKIKNFIYTFYGFGFSILALYVYDSAKKIKIFYYFLFFTSIFVCVYGCIEYAIKYNPFITLTSLLYNDGNSFSDIFIQEERGILSGRIQSFTNHPLTFGQIIQILLPYLILVGDKMPKFFTYISYSGLLICSFLCGSRTVFICVCGFLFFYSFLTIKNHIKEILFYGILAICILGFAAGPRTRLKITDTALTFVAFWQDQDKQKIQVKGSSKEMRLNQFFYTFERMDLKGLIVGLGPGYILQEKATEGTHPTMMGYESIFFSEFTSGGVIGFCMYMYMYYSLFLQAHIRAKRYLSRKKGIVLYGLFGTYLISLFMTGNMSSFSFFLILVVIYCKYLDLSGMEKQLTTICIQQKSQIENGKKANHC